MKLSILVADEYRARLLTRAGRTAPLLEIEGLLHSKGRLAARALVSDRPGRVRTGRGPAVTAMSRHTNPKAVEAGTLAAELAHALRRACDRGEVESLAIVAPPQFLGLIRERLDPQTRKRLA